MVAIRRRISDSVTRVSALEEAAEDDRLDPSIWKIAAVALFGSLLAQLDATIVNVSLSNLAATLNVSYSTIQWVTSSYLLALTLALPLNGWLVGRLGEKKLYLWCFAGFTLSSALCALARSADALIAFRILQGICGGVLAPMAQMMIAKAAGKQMARVAGYMALPILLAPTLGPIIAGVILQYASWRWLFLVNLPVGILALLLALVFLPEDRQEVKYRKLDWLGLTLLSPGLALFLYGSDKIDQLTGRAIFTTGIVMMAGFLWTARRKGDEALVDLRLFKGKVFSTAVITQSLSNGVQFAGQMLIPAFLIQACGRAPVEMGWMLAPLGFGMMLTYTFMGALTDRFGIRAVSTGGALVTLLATMPFIYLAIHGLDLFILIPTLFLRGLGMSAVGLPTMTAAYASVRKLDLPMATTSFNIVQRLGGPTMTTLCATFLAWRLGPSVAGSTVAAAYAWTFLLLCFLHACVLVFTLWLPRRIDDVQISTE